MQLHLRLIISLLSLALATHFCPGDVRADVTVEASLSHTSFPVDRMSQLTITVNGASRSAEISLPQIAKVSLHSRGQSSQINLINGNVSSSLAHNYLVRAAEPGNYTIPPVKVKISGKYYNTEPIDFTVTSGNQNKTSSSGQNEQGLDEVAFIRVTKTANHYPGEIVPISVKAYFNQKYRFDEISLPTLQGDGVASPQITENPVKSQESVNNRSYHVLTWNTSLSGVKVGQQKLKFTLDAALLISQQRRRQSPFGDKFFNNFFGGYQRKPITLESEETLFTVLPLPTANKPDDFTGAIGNFTFEVTASPLNLAVGEPITLKMKIYGKGNFDRVEAPVFPEGPDWKTYTPSAESLPAASTTPSSKVFEQALVVRKPTTTEIPSLSFSYFDPVQKGYVTRISPPIPILLESTAAQQIPTKVKPKTIPAQLPVSEENSEIFQGLAPIHLETGDFQERIEPVYKKNWYLFLCALAIVLIFTALLGKRRRLQKSRHPEIEQLQNRKQILKEDMQKIAQTVGSQGSTNFLAECRKAIQNQLGLLWGLEPAAISYTDLSKRLPPESPLLEIFTEAEAAAFGAVSISDEQMQTYMTTISTELESFL